MLTGMVLPPTHKSGHMLETASTHHLGQSGHTHAQRNGVAPNPQVGPRARDERSHVVFQCPPACAKKPATKPRTLKEERALRAPGLNGLNGHNGLNTRL